MIERKKSWLRVSVALSGAVVAIVLGASTAYATPSPSFGGCQLNGTAKFSNPLTVNQPTPVASAPNGEPWTNNLLTVDWGAAFTYSFDGDLTGCQAGNSSGPDSSAPASGRIYAGEPVNVGGTTYSWPFGAPTGHGGCTGSETDGQSLVVWADNSISVINYTTQGALAAVSLTGNFRSGQVTLTTPPDAYGNTTSKTFPLRYGSDYTAGPLAFEPSDPTACNGAGVSAAGIQGFLGDGYPQVS